MVQIGTICPRRLSDSCRFARNQALSNGRNCDLLPNAALTNSSTWSDLPSSIANRTNWSDFPEAVAALYELSRMDPDDIEDGIQHGRVTPDMTIRQAGSR